MIVEITRITPAYAGKSRLATFNDETGEGSPPRMRGKARPRAGSFPSCGITPAYAGKSISALEENQISRDHPRVCGEKTKKIP